MKFQYIKALTFALTVCSLTAHAKTSVSEPWARATVAGQVMGGAFVNLTSDQPALNWWAFHRPLPSKRTTRHVYAGREHANEAKCLSIDLPANQTVSLRPAATTSC